MVNSYLIKYSIMKKVSRKDLKAVAPIALEKHERRYGKIERRNIHVLISDMSNSPVFRMHQRNHWLKTMPPVPDYESVRQKIINERNS